MSFYEVNGICQTLFSFEKVETSNISAECVFRNSYYERIEHKNKIC